MRLIRLTTSLWFPPRTWMCHMTAPPQQWLTTHAALAAWDLVPTSRPMGPLSARWDPQNRSGVSLEVGTRGGVIRNYFEFVWCVIQAIRINLKPRWPSDKSYFVIYLPRLLRGNTHE
jgi:hypothetical protein